MKSKLLVTVMMFLSLQFLHCQDVIPFDTAHWEFGAQSYMIENFKGESALYIQNGMAQVKDLEMLNGTIEFDIYLEDRRGFPGLRFRAYADNQMESFYFRPHISGQPDANQAVSVFNGISGWQLYFGPRYSFTYDYNLDVWTHVKLVVHNDIAQIYIDHSSDPQHTWKLKQKQQAGGVMIGTGFSPCRFANFQFDPSQHELVDYKLNEPEKIEGVIKSWRISSKFAEKKLNDLNNLPDLIKNIKWLGTIEVEENNAANISRLATRPTPDENTVFAKLTIDSDRNQIKRFQFGYSDRAVTILNGQPIYKGNNNYRTRDYRYLGTIGLFDEVYLPLKKGKNELLIAVSESFGGWGVMGRFVDYDGIRIVEE